MSVTAIHDLCDALRHDLALDRRGPHVVALLERYATQHDDWKTYRLFDDGSYTRNLVERSGLFELIVLCWNPRQASPIHNHAGQHCWMAVLEGEIEETWFEHPTEGHVGGIVPTRSQAWSRGAVSYIHDDIALHAIRPGGDLPAVTLHLYSKPIETCNVYCPDTGRIHEHALTYTSIEGRRLSRPDDMPTRPGGEDA